NHHRLPTGAALWPSRELATGTSRSKKKRPGRKNNASAVSINLNYAVDLWGKLADSNREA
ncbi:RND transporter, partial [Pseudoalteromonas sp. S185]